MAESSTLNQSAMVNNQRVVNNIRAIIGVAAGIAAGALRFENFHGLLFFLGVSLLTSFVLYTSITKDQFESPLNTALIEGFPSSVFSFLLGWVTVYSLVET